MAELLLDAKVENLDTAQKFVNDFISNLNLSKKIIMQLDLIVEEVFVNISNYAYAPDGGKVKILASTDGESVTMTFIDDGVPYNPLAQAEPDINLSAEDRDIGGLGIFLTKKFSDELSYRHEDGKNILQIKKFLIQKQKSSGENRVATCGFQIVAGNLRTC